MVPLEVVVNDKKQIKFSVFYIWHDLLRQNQAALKRAKLANVKTVTRLTIPGKII